MDDVKDQQQSVEPQAEEKTAEQASQPDEQTTKTPEPKVAEQTPDTQPQPEPASNKGDLNIALKQERERVRELRRTLAERESMQQMQQMDPNDYEQWMQNPMSQELMVKVAKQELTDHAREVLDQYPELHPQVKKAILKNARGFVAESTTDVETAKLDLQEYVEQIAAEMQPAQAPQQQPSKEIRVANTNIPSSESDKTANAAEVEAILNKPVNEWTDDDEAVVKEYQTRNSK